MLTLAMLQRLWPSGNSKVPGLMEGIVSSAPRVFNKYGITSDLLIAHFMAQVSHECGAGREMVENINYTADRACQVWPSRYPTKDVLYSKIGSYPGDPQFSIKLMDATYGNRMGNRPGTHDGSTFIGRGLTQLTGRENYEKLSQKMGLDLINNPTLTCAPDHALEIGVADFIMCGCLPFAQQDDVVNVTKRLNGGTIGLDERKQWLAKWKSALAAAAIPIPPAPTPVPVPPKPKVQPKHVTGLAAVIAAIVAAIESHSTEFAIGIIAASIAVAVALHFLWKSK